MYRPGNLYRPKSQHNAPYVSADDGRTQGSQQRAAERKPGAKVTKLGPGSFRKTLREVTRLSGAAHAGQLSSNRVAKVAKVTPQVAHIETHTLKSHTHTQSTAEAIIQHRITGRSLVAHKETDSHSQPFWLQHPTRNQNAVTHSRMLVGERRRSRNARTRRAGRSRR